MRQPREVYSFARAYAWPRRLLRVLAAALPALLASVGGGANAQAAAPRATAMPEITREFRGVWVASVANIDWPSRPGLPVAQQKAELLALLDRAVQLRLNAVVLQVRPAADALYASPYEPWSEYLTGEMGKAPEPFYDPLAFAVREAHRRGLELHAWFNPYRARHPSAKSPVSPDHISRTRPELVRTYGNYFWMDPGEPAVQEWSLRVIRDVVRRYDIDGVQIDDYFYPYPERDSAGRVIPFPDEPSWSRYQRAGGRLSRDDWRRDNVNRFVAQLYRTVKREKPWVKVGISPFGIWRPGHPPQTAPNTFDAYEALYADARLWLRRGWADYFAPQLYWPIAQTAQSYPVLLRWWAEQNTRSRNLWPGNFTSRLGYGDKPFWRTDEVIGQIYVTRGQPGASGNLHFSMRIFMQNPDSIVERLRAGPYAQPALIPASPWLSAAAPPGRPRAELRALANDTAAVLLLTPARGTQPTWWAVRARYRAGWTTKILPGWQRADTLMAGMPDSVAVSAVDRVGKEGPAAVLSAPR